MKKQYSSSPPTHRYPPSSSSGAAAAAAANLSSPVISPTGSMETGSAISETFSNLSMSSTYRHHQAGPFMPSTPTGASTTPRGATAAMTTTPQPMLGKDQQHKPKTLGSFGLLVVGLGGANGTTLLAGVLANRLKIDWFGPRGEPNSPNYYGCITQLDQRGKYGGVGYRNKVKGLADASMAAIGGWVCFFSLKELCGVCSIDGSHLSHFVFVSLVCAWTLIGYSTDKAG